MGDGAEWFKEFRWRERIEVYVRHLELGEESYDVDVIVWGSER